MSEQNFRQKPDFNLRDKLMLIKLRLEMLAIRQKINLISAAREVKYRMCVSPEKDSHAREMALAFAGEAIDFLGDNLSAKLSPINPTREQINLFNFFLRKFDDGVFCVNYFRGVDSIGNPYLLIRLDAKEEFQDPILASLGLYSEFSGSFTVTWLVNRDYPFALGLTGLLPAGYGYTNGIDFLVMPEKPSDSTQIMSFLGLDERDKNKKITIGLYGRAERIVFNTETQLNREDISLTTQYFLLGSFEGTITNKTYWLYGSNKDRHQKKGVRPKVQVGELAPQPVIAK